MDQFNASLLNKTSNFFQKAWVNHNIDEVLSVDALISCGLYVRKTQQMCRIRTL